MQSDLVQPDLVQQLNADKFAALVAKPPGALTRRDFATILRAHPDTLYDIVPDAQALADAIEEGGGAVAEYLHVAIMFPLQAALSQILGEARMPAPQIDLDMPCTPRGMELNPEALETP